MNALNNKSIRVLVVDDMSVMRLLVRNHLRAIGIDKIVLAANGREAVDLLKKWTFDLVLTDWNMPLMDGLELLHYIRQSETHSSVPVILITAEGNRSQVRNAIAAGVTEFLVKPFTAGTFQRRVQLVINRIGAETPIAAPIMTVTQPEATPSKVTPSVHPVALDAMATILTVDDIPDNIQLIAGILKDEYRVKSARSGEQALRIARSDDPPHLILLDIVMPDMDGFAVCRELKADEHTRDIPIIFLSAKINAEDVIGGLDLGAVDYVTKPTDPAILRARIRTHLRLSRQHHALREQSLVALENAHLREEIERMSRHDIKNPLNAILALTHTLADSDNLRTEQRECIAAMTESAQYVLNMINHSLALQRMEMGSYQLTPVTFSLAELLEKVIVETRSAFGELEVIFHQLSLDPMLVRGEELLCHALLSNVIRNAAEASPNHSPIRIRFKADTKNAQVELRIHNLGAVPLSLRDTFFEKYATAGKAQGTGLGTYSAKLMAETQGGTLTMHTNDATGTVLTLTLPAA